MTKKEALQATINFPLTGNAIELALIKAGMNGADGFSAADEKSIDLCAAGLILTMLTTPNISEGGYSISLGDRDGLLTIRSLLLAKWGEGDLSGPKIKAVKKW